MRYISFFTCDWCHRHKLHYLFGEVINCANRYGKSIICDRCYDKYRRIGRRRTK